MPNAEIYLPLFDFPFLLKRGKTAHNVYVRKTAFISINRAAAFYAVKSDGGSAKCRFRFCLQRIRGNRRDCTILIRRHPLSHAMRDSSLWAAGTAQSPYFALRARAAQGIMTVERRGALASAPVAAQFAAPRAVEQKLRRSTPSCGWMIILARNRRLPVFFT